MWSPGLGELLIILVIVVLVFGTGKVTGLGKSLGTAISEFKDAVRGVDDTNEPESGEKTE